MVNVRCADTGIEMECHPDFCYHCLWSYSDQHVHHGPGLKQFKDSKSLEGSTIVDIGAHFGSLSLIMAKHFNVDLAIAVEPVCHEAIKKNAEHNLVSDRVLVLPLAVVGKDQPGPIRMRRPGNDGTASYLSDDGPLVADAVTISFRQLLHAVGKEIAYLKMDIEGAEHCIFMDDPGACQLIADQVKHFDIELHNAPTLDAGASGCQEIVDGLRSVGVSTEAGNLTLRNYKEPGR